MTNTLSFPGLGLELQLNRVAFSIGSVDIYWYGIIIATGFLLAILYTTKRMKEFGLDEDRVIDVIIGGAVGGIIGARTYFVVFQWSYYKDHLNQIFDTRSGGMAIYGGIIGAVLVGYFMAKIRRVKFLPLIDLASCGFLIGQGIGRWGNFVNIEAFGSNTTLPWGMTSPVVVKYLESKQAQLAQLGVMVDPTVPVHPTFFYESVWCIVGFLLLALYTKHRKFDGQIALMYAGWYGLGRFFIEGLRTDSLMIGTTGLRVSQVLAGVMVIFALTILVLMLNQVKKHPEREYLYVNTKESKLILAKKYDYKTGKEMK